MISAQQAKIGLAGTTDWPEWIEVAELVLEGTGMGGKSERRSTEEDEDAVNFMLFCCNHMFHHLGISDLVAAFTAFCKLFSSALDFMSRRSQKEKIFAI